MDNRQNDEIVKNSEEPEREFTVSPDKKPWKERFEKLPKIRKILLITVLALSALPFLMTDLKAENDGVGSVVFISSIVLLIPAGIGFIITLIQTIWIRKKLRTDSVASGSNMVEILALPIFATAYGLSTLITEGSPFYGFEMLVVYFIIGFAVLLLDLLVDNWKFVLNSKTVQLTLLAFLTLFVLTTFMRFSIFPALSASALLVAAASVLLYKKPEKFKDQIFTKKQFKICFSAATAIFVLFCALSIASTIVTTQRTDDLLTKLTADLNNKIFITDDTDIFIRGYIFDNEGNYRSIYKDGDLSRDDCSINIQFYWFGFGTARMPYIFDTVTYDEQGNAVALVKNNYDGTETVYKLSDSIPCFEHEFGEYITIEEAKSCQEPGIRKRTCKKCGYEEMSTFIASHNYVNGKCTVCGEKEPAEYSDIEADTWYVYNPIPQLKFQNCEINQANPQGGGARLMISYYPVCSHCHALGRLKMITVSSEETNFYYCPECDGYTYIAFAIVP